MSDTLIVVVVDQNGLGITAPAFTSTERAMAFIMRQFIDQPCCKILNVYESEPFRNHDNAP